MSDTITNAPSQSVNDLNTVTQNSLHNTASTTALQQNVADINLKFSEFEDRFIVDWKRVRSQIEHEDNLVNHRISWLLASNAFLLTGYFLTAANLKKDLLDEAVSLLNLFLYIIPVFGIIISAVIFYTVGQAYAQNDLIQTWWYDKIKDETESKKHPQLTGGKQQYRTRRFYPTLLIPMMLVFLWIAMLVIISRNLVPQIPIQLWYFLAGLTILVGAVLAGMRLERKRHSNMTTNVEN